MAPRLINGLGITDARHPRLQRRTFLGLQQTPPPNPRVMGYLVAQGLAVVLLADVGIATLLNHQTVVRSIAQSAGFWKEGPTFNDSHKPSAED